ncbi:MAG: hypothetical protein ACRDD8_09860 [Bacteroidales bacterium]
MKVISISRKSDKKSPTYKTSVKSGFIQRFKAEMCDVDIDSQSDKRQNVKEYIEQRYNAGNGQQVFSAGTFTTLKAKAALSDVARTHNVPTQIVKYVTKAIDDDKASFTDLFKIAVRSRKLKEFIERSPMIFEDLRPILGNQKSTSVHASAVIPTPAIRDGKKVECFDYLPIRKMGNLLVSEFDGYDCDAVGLLKIDALNTKELTKISRMFEIVKNEYGVDLSLEKIEQELLEDPEVYECFQNGYTQDIFQFGSDGITKLTVDIKPENIFDLAAINALYRPATIEVGSTESFGRYKRGEAEPEYMWGTYEATKDTYSLLVYQEQLALIANQVGGLSLSDGVKLVKYISKKKIDKIMEYKEKFVSGAVKNGCPEEQAVNIWSNFEAAGSYLFNKCIAGSETLLGHDCTIEEMFTEMKFVGVEACSKTEDCRIVPNTIDDIQYAGFRDVFEIVTESGAKIKTTDNHRFPTQRGKITVSDMVVGEDMLYVTSIITFNLEKITSIKNIGRENVYDITMTAPNHNYINNYGIVTCNSHATAYSLLSYVGMYIKCHYPTAFYTVALEFCKDDDIPVLMGEMESSSKCKIVPPDINKSMDTFTTDYETNEIFWSLSRIKFVGSAGTSMICDERRINGPFKSYDSFIERMESYIESVKESKKENDEKFTNPLNFRCIKNMIIAGCFDHVENLTDTPHRFKLIQKLHEYNKRTIPETEFPTSEVGKAHFWSRLQVTMSSIGCVDYKRVLDLYGFTMRVKGATYHTFEEILDIYEPIKKSIIAGTIEEIEEKTYSDKNTGEKKLFAKVLLSENNDNLELMIWDNAWKEMKDHWVGKQGSIVMFVGHINYSQFNNTNVAQINKGGIYEFAK